MSTISFHSGINELLLLIGGAVAIALMVLGYTRAFHAVPRQNWMVLCVLRLTAVFTILWLLARPVLTYQRELEERPALVFLLDHSGSMGIADDPTGATRLDQVVQCVQAWRDRLKTDFEMHFLAVAETADVVPSAEPLSKLKPQGESTSLTRGLGVAQQIAAAHRAEAAFLFSDGMHNAAGDPVVAAKKVGIPIYTIGTGNALRDRTAKRDLRVTDVAAPPQIVVNNRARILGYVEAVGFGGRLTNVALEEDGRQVAEAELALDDKEGAQEVVFEFVPNATGVHKYTVRVAPNADERIPQNNERSTSALVIDARIRVLYVEGTLRAEYGALVGRFLTKDPNLEFSSLVQTRPNVFLHRTNIEGWNLKTIPDDPEVLNSFQVIVIGDLDASYLQPQQMERIRDRVKSGAGLLMIGGYHSLGPGGYQGTPLAECLPVDLGGRDIGQITEPFQPRLTPEGRQHPIFANIAPFFPSQGADAPSPGADAIATGLPELEGSVRVGLPGPAATVLAVHPGETVRDKPMPVLAVQPFGSGRAAVFTADTTRNWHQVLRSEDRETPFLRFWGQMIRWLSGRADTFESAAGITAVTDQAWYRPEAPVEIQAVVRGSEGEAVSNVPVTASFQGPGGKLRDLTLSPVTGPAGNFAATFLPPRSGHYEIQISAVVGDQTLRAETLRIDVGRPNMEFDQPELNENLLTQIAAESGGKYAQISTADRLIDQLERRRERRLVEYEYRLAWPPPLWCLFVVVLTAEWVFRRRQRLR